MVLVRVRSNTLASQIRDAVRDSLRGADSDIDAEGERLGKRFSNSISTGMRNREDGLGRDIGSSVRRSTVSSGDRVDQHGSTLGRRFSNSVGVGLRDNEDRLSSALGASMRRVGRTAGTDFANGVRTATPNLGPVGTRAGQQIQNGLRRSLFGTTGSRRNNILGIFSGLGSEISRSFNLGIGASRMGPAVISALALAGPSILSAAGALGTALATEIVTAMAAIGPGLGGAIGVGLAGGSSLLLNFGLLMAAFKSGLPELDALGKSAKELVTILGTPIARGMLDGMTTAVKTLHDALPQLNDVLGTTGEAFGRVAAGIAQTITSAENMARIRSILLTNVRFIDSFGAAVSALTTSFLILFKASAPFIDFIGDAVKNFSEWAAASLAVSEANGNLDRWMAGMLQNFKDLWQIVKDFSKGIGNLFAAAAPAGKTLLEAIAGIAERFRAWTSDSRNMARMTAFFEKAHILASKVFEVLGAIFTAGGRAFEGMDLGPLLHGLDVLKDTIAPAIARIFNQIQRAAGPNLTKILDNIGTIFTKMADSGVIGTVAAAISSLFLALTELLSTDFGAQIAALGAAWLLFGGIVRALVTPLLAIGRLFLTLSPGALGLAAAISGVVGVLILAWSNSEKFRDAVSRMWTTLQDQLSPILGVVGEQFGRLWDAIQRLGTAIGDFLAPVIDNILTPVLTTLGTVLGGAIAVILENLTLLADFLTGVISGDWQPFIDEVTRLGTVIRGWWEDFTAWFGPAWSNFWSVDIPAAWDAFVISISEQWDTLWNVALPATWETFDGWFQGAWDALLNDGIPNIWDAFVDWMTTSWNMLWSDEIPNLLQDGLDRVGQFMDTFWNDTFPTAMSDALDGIGWLFDNFWTTVIPDVWDKFTAWFTPKWDAWWAEASTGWLDDFDFAKEWDTFWDETVPQAFDDFTSSFGETWDTFWTVTLPDAAGQLGINILGQLDDIGTTIGGWFDGIKGDFGANWSNFWNVTLPDFVGQLGIDALNALSGNVDVNLFGWLDTFATNFGTEWSTLWSVTLPEFISGLWTGGVAKLDEFSNNFGTFWSTFATDVSGKWDAFWGGTLVDWIASLSVKGAHPLDDFRAMVSGKWDEFKGWLGGLWDNFWGTELPTKAETVTPAVATKWEAFKAMLSGKWETFKSWLGGLWNSFWGTELPNKVDGVTPAVSTKMEQFKSMLSEKWESAKRAVIEKVNSMISDVSGLFTNWSFPDIGAILTEHIVKPFQDAWTKVTGLVGQITGATSTLNTAKSAMDAANAALGNAVAGNAIANQAFLATPASINNNPGAPRSILPPDGWLRALLDIPGLATGGTVSPTPGGTVFRLAEAGRPERVEPLDSSGLSSRDRAMIKTIVASTVSMMSGGGVNVDVQIGEQGLNQFVTQTIRRENDSLARRIGRVRR